MLKLMLSVYQKCARIATAVIVFCLSSLFFLIDTRISWYSSCEHSD